MKLSLSAFNAAVQIPGSMLLLRLGAEEKRSGNLSACAWIAICLVRDGTATLILRPLKSMRRNAGKIWCEGRRLQWRFERNIGVGVEVGEKICGCLKKASSQS